MLEDYSFFRVYLEIYTMKPRLVILLISILYLPLCKSQTREELQNLSYKEQFKLFKQLYKEKPNPMIQGNLIITSLKMDAPKDTTMYYVNRFFLNDPVRCCYHLYYRDYCIFSDDYNRPHEIVESIRPQCEKVWASFDHSLILAMEVMQEMDQKYRTFPDDNPWLDGNDSIWTVQTCYDQFNQELLAQIFSAYGYPSRALVGPYNDEIAFMIFMHADSAFKEEYWPLIDQAFTDDKIIYSRYPMAFDRMQMLRGQPQRFGTQAIFNDSTDRLELYPLIDYDKVEIYRKEYSLFPLDDYLQRLGAVNIYKE